ncbi:myotubularin-related protein 6-like isoform X2 [Gordionus sp. m RMFG-2023]|uniref:myotubularin-related protein 6-like isoform X2 n=1 Tax=Gordionus sp. m RMFG-2023 TaxID=3053472 RepID=UPI0031FBB005
MEHIQITKIEDVMLFKNALYDQANYNKVNLYITATHLIISEVNNKEEFWILHTMIDTIELLPLDIKGCPILLKCKDFQTLILIIQRDSDRYAFNQTLLNLSRPKDLPVFHNQSKIIHASNPENEYIFDLNSEFKRMGLPNNKWILCYLNTNYQICETYPEILYVPASSQPQTLVAASKFRSKNRIPVLTYLDKNGVALCRSSQPLSGLNARSMEDETLLNDIVYTNPNYDPKLSTENNDKLNAENPFAKSSNLTPINNGAENFRDILVPQLCIVDTRPKINAIANRAKGAGGYENPNFYAGVKFLFCGVENIHVMRNSLNKLITVCQSKWENMPAYLNALQSCGWLKHIRAILNSALLVAQMLREEKVNVLVHCSDGWDRTSQTCSLAQIMLDPYYRTIKGYFALIEKDWLAFGHKFNDRCGHLNGDKKEVSPVFLQFLDCTWQLLIQFPRSFEFNSRFLEFLGVRVYSCDYLTFLGNSEKWRHQLIPPAAQYGANRNALWNHILNDGSGQFLNPFYVKNIGTTCHDSLFLKPNICAQNIRLWLNVYAKFDANMHPKVDLLDILTERQIRIQELREELKILQKNYENFQNLAISQAENSNSHGAIIPSKATLPEPNITVQNDISDFVTIPQTRDYSVASFITEPLLTNSHSDASTVPNNKIIIDQSSHSTYDPLFNNS